MVRETSLEAYRIMKENGVMGRAKLEVYHALCLRGPCTGAELFYFMTKSRNPTHSNITTRLGELRSEGVVKELPKRICTTTGRNAYGWKIIPGKLPIKFEKPERNKCATCGGKGYIEEQQAKLFED